jgi:hypothetical protein
LVTEEGREVSKQWMAKGKPGGCWFRKEGKNAATHWWRAIWTRTTAKTMPQAKPSIPWRIM